jgi:hypothetical protein
MIINIGGNLEVIYYVVITFLLVMECSPLNVFDMPVDCQSVLHVFSFRFSKLTCKIFSESVIYASSSAKRGCINVCFLIIVALTDYGYLFA